MLISRYIIDRAISILECRFCMIATELQPDAREEFYIPIGRPHERSG